MSSLAHRYQDAEGAFALWRRPSTDPPGGGLEIHPSLLTAAPE
jgi:hypothetical protein